MFDGTLDNVVQFMEVDARFHFPMPPPMTTFPASPVTITFKDRDPIGMTVQFTGVVRKLHSTARVNAPIEEKGCFSVGETSLGLTLFDFRARDHHFWGTLSEWREEMVYIEDPVPSLETLAAQFKADYGGFASLGKRG